MDDKKRLEHNFINTSVAPIKYKINLRDSMVFEAFENNELKNAWKIVNGYRKQSTILNDCLVALNINSGGDLMEHFFDTKINGQIVHDFSSLERDAHNLLKVLVQDFVSELPSNYGKFLKIFSDDKTFTQADYWAEDFQTLLN